MHIHTGERLKKRSLFFRKTTIQHKRSHAQQQQTIRLSQYGNIHSGGDPCADAGRQNPPRQGTPDGGAIHQTAAAVKEKPHPGRRQEEEKIDPLRRLLIYVEKEGHYQQEEGAASDAPGRKNSRQKACNEGNKKIRHSKYRTPP